ncbi:MAG: histidine phosphatase family protein [Burkholderia sp.]|nr:histidine phosphatase family protein [Burkholderia sp.]
MDIILIRHLPIDINDSVCYGCSDVPLAISDEIAIQVTLDRLTYLGAPIPYRIWSSPLIRCSKVSERIAASLDVPFQSDIGLQEINFGSWEMHNWNNIDRTDLDAWANNLMETRIHKGESVAQFASRINQIFDVVSSINFPQWVFTHAGVIRVFTEIALRLPICTLLARSIPFGGIVWLRRDALYDVWKIIHWDNSNGSTYNINNVAN